MHEGQHPRVYNKPFGYIVDEAKEIDARVKRRRRQDVARISTEGFYVAFFSAIAYLTALAVKPEVPPSPQHETQTVAPLNAPERPVIPSVVSQPESTIDTPATEKIPEALLQQAEQAIEALRVVGGTLRQKSPALQKTAGAQELCTFADNWYEKQKPELAQLWHYVDDKEHLWGADIHNALKTAYEITLKVSKKGKAPKDEADFRVKLHTALANPKDTETKCGKLFTMAVVALKGYSLFGGRDYISDGQKMAEQLLVGSIEIIRKDVAEARLNNDIAGITRAIAVAQILGVLVESASR